MPPVPAGWGLSYGLYPDMLGWVLDGGKGVWRVGEG